ncbi:hypothetical protein BST33_03685 [Mycolicibacter minnesotensis]|uniref:Uncharacterized protein n=1 Tax=Mycolicibacter minnesotensis TaxID=1118379 RepID=A0A7I7R9V7_9MYCO|nr:DUF732 domain-containing protein [Mycolicibacter minnesotensis]ORB03066.1 hypothetical protein BST33_03685 [Mycolicibacter minnesotensis]BBY35464.1 hypothetical protein MMIN_35250 [Mycolicibacter minnesotensis]
MRWPLGLTAPLAAAGIATGALLGAATASANDAGFMAYLNSHGYTARYADDAPITEPSVRALGHMICENLHVGRTVEMQAPYYPAWPQFPLIAEAARQELCPGS